MDQKINAETRIKDLERKVALAEAKLAEKLGLGRPSFALAA
jgi:hypothetical protein